MMRLEFGKSAVEARFEAYVERLGEVLGHADRFDAVWRLRFGTVSAGGAQERGAHGGAAGAREHQRGASVPASLRRRVRRGETTGSWRRSAIRFCRCWRRRAALRPGSSTIRPFPRRGAIRWAWRGSIAANWARRRTARWRSRCRWRARAPACRWPGVCTCPRTGPGTRRGAARPAFPTTSVPHQARDRPGADPRGTVHGPAARRRLGRRVVRQRHPFPRRADGAGGSSMAWPSTPRRVCGRRPPRPCWRRGHRRDGGDRDATCAGRRRLAPIGGGAGRTAWRRRAGIR